MRNKFITGIILLLACVSLATITCSKGKPGLKGLRIILIRHGEKPGDGDNLSCAGLNRALKLPEVLKAKYGLPDDIFVPSPGTGKQTKNARMLETVLPYATKYNLNINTSFTVDETDKLSDKLKKGTGTVLVVWEHKGLDDIAQMLGAKGFYKWDSQDYDSIWIITFSHGKAVLTVDKEGIRPAGGCAF